MGAADAVPGVSGGTIAFITGIYETLINSIRSFDGKAVKLLLSLKIKDLWAHVNGTFLLVLLAGVGTSILSLSRVIPFLLSNYPVLLWSFFFGLIIASAVVIGRKVPLKLGNLIAGIVGLVIGYLITLALPANTTEALWFVFLSGAIAICAMILPGISGSFILLLLGKYEFIFTALKELRLNIIIVFAAGCGMGLLAFSHLLNWLLKRYHDLTIALLTGLMIGSLNKVWPWKKTLSYYTDRKGIEKPLKQINVLPHNYEGEAYLLYAILLVIFGFALVYFLERLLGQDKKASQ